MAFLIPMALIFGPFGGLLVVSLIIWYWLKRMAYVQEQDAEQSRRKEAMLVNRERHVLISTLEGELTENKNKVEAFLGVAHDLPEPDLRRGPGQADAAAPAPRAFDEARAREVVHHLHQMVLRNTVGARDFGNRAAAIRIGRQMRQRPEGVVGVAGQSHRPSR